MKQKAVVFKHGPHSVSSKEREKHKYVLYSLLLALIFSFHFGYSINYSTSDELIFPEQLRTIKGVVKDANGVPVMGANVLVLGTARGVLTNFDGEYEIKANTGDVLEFSFLGMATKRVTIGSSDTIDIIMEESAEALEEVVLVSFGKQKKTSLISSISTVKPADLKIPSSNLTTALAGNVAGIIAYQRTGEPGADDASFFIRGVTSFGYGNSPLILIDGVELTTRDLARLQPDDIASFSIMKDATATSLYGARGANGVIYVTTKEGVEGPARISARIEASISSATQDVDFADPITYMQLHNEAVRTRDPLGILPYSQKKVDQTIAGSDPILYPTTNWQDELFKDNTLNKRFNFSVNGGGKVARYYVSVAASQDNGVLDVPSVSNYNSNINYQQFQLRSNTNISLSETTKLKMSFIGNYDDYTGPLDSGEALYRKVMRSNPVYFRPYYEADAANEYTNHILFGNYGDGNYLNPYADMVKGYRESGSSKIITQIELEQNLKSITEGLMGKVVINANRESGNTVNRSYNPFYYQPRISTLTNELILNPLNEETGTEYLDYREGNKYVTSSTYFESSLTYNKNINDLYDVSGMLVFTMNNRRVSNAGNLQESLPFRNMGLAGRFTLSSRDKYFGEFTFGYNGSERFDKKERWGYFPSLGLGWIISNEDFFEDYKDVVTNLKLKTTYGLVGNDQIGSASDRFFYLSQVNLSDDGRGYVTGTDFDKYLPGVSIQRYANDQISWETAEKFNLGLEVGLFDKWNLEADFFKEYRSNILADRIVLASMGLESGVRANIGEAKSTGIDGTLVYNNSFTNGLWIQARANFTYATSKIVKIEEPDYSSTPWLSRVGQPINQVWGYVAERLFVDENEVNNSPVQTFGEYAGGDIKYKDINGDGRISGLDRVPIGNPTTPEIVYGFGVSAGYKGFDISCFFQGLANESFWINPVETAPFVDIWYEGEPNWESNNQLLQVWADSHWSENNRDLYAKWPRLSENISSNNTQTSTWFMQDGSFLRLKSLEVGYNLPQKVLDKYKMDRIRFYVTGNNLMAFSNFKLWDPEMAGNGLSYPTQRVINAGVQISL
ncbi:TonB-dependent receptor [Arenibacter sp. M-2]|uniref:SusC/RagA family TonB-linked outer membrane protein n=1 Tax=Arenibacter sp. M-2 TaxID=3053612 RepID=UPI002570EEB6|nr:TonB-dependent receptor [Arenibacter sp. M-2]MDL5512356.1 TonB-dependent receptor [Arenibacter sp. M-2]|tara:strand:- start:44104 stop:47325 length:3222 start_codon:yes stop_codon:yes gene_type:complete